MGIYFFEKRMHRRGGDVTMFSSRFNPSAGSLSINILLWPHTAYAYVFGCQLIKKSKSERGGGGGGRE